MNGVGNISVGTTTSSTERLYVKGNAVFSNTNIMDNTKANPKILGEPNATLPSFTWTDEIGTGLGKLGSKKLGLYVGGVPHVSITEKTFRISPAYSQPMPAGDYKMYVTGELGQNLALYNVYHNGDYGFGVQVLSNQKETKCFAAGIRRATEGGEGGKLVYDDNFFVYASGDLYTHGVVNHTGITFWSDTTLKQNIEPLNLSGQARLINPIKYSWKKDSTNKVQFGFSAQQVQSVVPEFVEVKDTFLTVNQMGLLALLYEDHKILANQVDSMNQMILSLNDQLAVCCAMNQQARLAPAQTAVGNTNVRLFSDNQAINQVQNARLDQNRPNPFSKRTEIPYFVPVGKNASLWITDLNGKKLVSFNLESGEQVLEIKNHHLSSGIYLYNLVIEGEVVASRKMTIE